MMAILSKHISKMINVLDLIGQFGKIKAGIKDNTRMVCHMVEVSNFYKLPLELKIFHKLAKLEMVFMSLASLWPQLPILKMDNIEAIMEVITKVKEVFLVVFLD